MNKRILLTGLFCLGIIHTPVQAIFTPKKFIKEIEAGISDAVYKGAVDGIVNRLHDFALDAAKEDKIAVLLAAVQLLGFDLEDIKIAQDRGYDLISEHVAGMLKDAGYGENQALTKAMKTFATMYLSSDQFDRIEKALELKRELKKYRKKLKQAESDLGGMWQVSKKVFKVKKRKNLTEKIQELKNRIKDAEKEIKGQESPAKRVLMQIITKL